MDDFLSAILVNDANQVMLSIANGIDVNAKHNSTPPLVLAARQGHTAIVELLLSANAFVNECDERGCSALTVAASCGHVAVVERLLDARADVTQEEVRGTTTMTALDYALDRNDARMTFAIMRRNAVQWSGTECFRAASLSRELVELVCRVWPTYERGQLGRFRTLGNETPAHITLEGRDDSTTLHRLINVLGFDINAFDRRGVTCVHRCIIHRRERSLVWLITAGADLHRVASVVLKGKNDVTYQTALELACHCDDVRSALLLAAAGVNLVPRGRFILSADIYHILIASGIEFSDSDAVRVRARAPNADQLNAACARVASARLDLVRNRAFEVCVGLQSLRVSALEMCEVLLHACGPAAPAIALHRWWTIATTVKHFQERRGRERTE